MNTPHYTPHSHPLTKSTADAPSGTVRVEAFYTTLKKLGHWTEARDYEVRARRSTVHLDLRSAHVPEGDIELHFDCERSIIKLLVPDGSVLDEGELSLPGRSTVKDGQRHIAGGGRRIRLTGELQRSEIRVVRGGMATLTALFTREFIDEARRAHREGSDPALPDPSQTA